MSSSLWIQLNSTAVSGLLNQNFVPEKYLIRLLGTNEWGWVLLRPGLNKLLKKKKKKRSNYQYFDNLSSTKTASGQSHYTNSLHWLYPINLAYKTNPQEDFPIHFPAKLNDACWSFQYQKKKKTLYRNQNKLIWISDLNYISKILKAVTVLADQMTSEGEKQTYVCLE